MSSVSTYTPGRCIIPWSIYFSEWSEVSAFVTVNIMLGGKKVQTYGWDSKSVTKTLLVQI
jgi:hypothetical protein